MNKTWLAFPIAVFLLASGYAVAGVPAWQQAEDTKVQAENWMAEADSTEALVAGVLKSALDAGAEEHAVAKDNVVDARHWMDEGVKAREAAQQAWDAGDYAKASSMGNMAWQYYVKAGTAAVLAARIASGGS